MIWFLLSFFLDFSSVNSLYVLFNAIVGPLSWRELLRQLKRSTETETDEKSDGNVDCLISKTLNNTLTDEQRKEYDRLTTQILEDIENGLDAFHRAGEKLLRIRDRRLYREGFANFEEFARTVLGHSRHYANRLITGYVLIQDMIAQGITVLPDNERVARELAKYPKKDRKEI